MRTIAAALLMCVLASPVAAAPNALIVMTDDMAASDLPYMPRVQALLGTPGLTFSQFLATTSLCCPSRATLLRGQYAHNHGVLDNEEPGGGWPVFAPLEADTVATRLQGAGYRTGYLGKYLNGYASTEDGVTLPPIPPGWETWAVLMEPAQFTDPVMHMNGNRTVRVGYQTDLIADDADAFVRAVDPRPWFAIVSPFAPHAPAVPAPRHAGLFANVLLPMPPNWNEGDVTDKPSWVASLPPLRSSAIRNYTALHQRRLESSSRWMRWSSGW